MIRNTLPGRLVSPSGLSPITITMPSMARNRAISLRISRLSCKRGRASNTVNTGELVVSKAPVWASDSLVPTNWAPIDTK